MTGKLKLSVLKDTYAICKLAADQDTPHWINQSGFYSVTRTADELSIVCNQSIIADDIKLISRDWSVLKIIGPLDFSLVGIIANISDILKNNKIAIFVISTYETDYLLLKSHNLKKATHVLTASGYDIISQQV